MKHQLISAVLAAAVMLTPVCSVSTAAAVIAAEENILSGQCGENVTWTFDSDTGTLTLSGTGDTENYSQGTNPAPWSKFNREITALKIGEGITGIGYQNFMSMDGLTEVVIPEGVTSIKGNAFFGCSNLRSVSIPGSVTEIGGWAFDYTAWLDAKRAENPLVTVNSILIDGKTCTGAVTVPDGVKHISDAAFANCEEITAVTLPDSVSDIGATAFTRCPNLADVTIPESVTYIGGWAFEDTAWLTARQEESPFVTVRDMLLDGTCCSGAVKVPDGIRLICGGAFENTRITEIELPASTEIIDYRVFCDCSALTFVCIPSGVTYIGDRAFERCTKLEQLTVPHSVTFIGTDTFSMHSEDFAICGYTGTRAESYARENEIPFFPMTYTIPVILGDVTEDNAVDVGDAVMLARFLAEDKEAVITAHGQLNADCNRNGQPDSEDVVLILKAIARLIQL